MKFETLNVLDWHTTLIIRVNISKYNICMNIDKIERFVAKCVSFG